MDKRSLEYLAGRFREAETRAEFLRIELAEAIRQAAAEELPQKDICDATGYTRQQVRRIVKASTDGEAGGQSAKSPRDDE
jgi:predicted DNA-binding protein (UPF0251 family)